MSALPNTAVRQCRLCHAWKPLDAFYPNRAGKRRQCIACELAAARERRGLRSIEIGPPPRWDIDAHIARLERQIAEDLARGGSAFDTPSR